MDRKLAALVACSIAFGQVAQASPISQARIQELMASRDRQEVKLEALRSRDREILVQLGEILSQKYGQLLEGSEMVFTRLVENGTVYYRMDFMGLKGRDRARALCEILEVEKCITLGKHGQMTLLHTDGDVTVSATGVVEDTRPFTIAGDAAAASFNPKARQIEERVRKMLDPLGIFPLPRPDMGPAAPTSDDEVPSEVPADEQGPAPTPARPEEAETGATPLAPRASVRPAARGETAEAVPEISVIEYFDTDEDFEEPVSGSSARSIETDDVADRSPEAVSAPAAGTPDLPEIIVIETEAPEGADLEEVMPSTEPQGSADVEADTVIDVESDAGNEAPGTADAEVPDPSGVDIPAGEDLPEQVRPAPVMMSPDMPEEMPAAEPEMPTPEASVEDAQVPQASGFVTPDEQPSLRRRLFEAGSDIAYVEVAQAADPFVKSAFAATTNLGLAGRGKDVAMRIPGVGEVDIDRLKTVVPGFGEEPEASPALDIARVPASLPVSRAAVTEVASVTSSEVAAKPVEAPVVSKPVAEPVEVETLVYVTGPKARGAALAALEMRQVEEARLAAEAAALESERIAQAEALEAERIAQAEALEAQRLAEAEAAERASRPVFAALPKARGAAIEAYEVRLAAAEAEEERSRRALASLPLPRGAAMAALSVEEEASDPVQVAEAEAVLPSVDEVTVVADASEPGEERLTPARTTGSGAGVSKAPAGNAFSAMMALAPMSVPLGGPSEAPKFKIAVPLDNEGIALGSISPDLAVSDPVRISTAPKVEVALLGKVSFDDQFAVPASVDFSQGRDAGRLQKMPDARPDLSLYVAEARERSVNIETARIALEVTRGLRERTDLAQVPGIRSDDGIAPPGFFGEDANAPAEPVKPKSGSLSLLDRLLAEGDVEPAPQEASGDMAAPAIEPEPERSSSRIFGADMAREVRQPTEVAAPVEAQADPVKPATTVRPQPTGLDALRAATAARPKVQDATTTEMPAPDTAMEAPAETTPKAQPQPEPKEPELTANQRQAIDILQQIAAAAEKEKAEVQESRAQPRVQPQVQPRTEPQQRVVRESRPEPLRKPAPQARDVQTSPAREVAQSVSRQPARDTSAPAATQQFDVEDLRIELSYVGSRDNVRARAAELKAFFPPVMLEKGRFFGASVPGQPGRYVVGIEATDLAARDDLVWYLEQMGMPWTQRR